VLVRQAAVATSLAKRAFDAAAAVVALILFAPLLLLLAGLIVMEDGGPVFFRQHRTGFGGHPFVVLKFRSMRVAEDGPEVRQARAEDERTTGIGRVIRRLSLDELPQLINVLRGDMSLIGPRPHPITLDNAWAAMVPHYGSRFRARPGLTGYAQILGYRGLVRNQDDIAGRVAADNYYIDNWSWWLDLKILARTLPLIIWDENAV